MEADEKDKMYGEVTGGMISAVEVALVLIFERLDQRGIFPKAQSSAKLRRVLAGVPSLGGPETRALAMSRVLSDLIQYLESNPTGTHPQSPPHLRLVKDGGDQE